MMTDAPQTGSILIVDDNRDLADNLAELLRDDGPSTAAAYAPGTALTMMREQPFDLAVIDIRMPEGSGMSLLRDVRRSCPEAEVIVMTANASLNTAMGALHEGAFAYLEKPFDPQHLITLCRRALTQTALRRERRRLQQDLTRSEALYRRVVDSVDALIVGIGADDRLAMCNQGAMDALGYSRTALLSTSLVSLAASEAGGERLAEVVASARAGRKPVTMEVTLRRSDGSERVTHWTFSPLEPGARDGSQDSLVLGVASDLTDRVDLERRAAEAEAMASIATLTAGLAHEIRNPLNAAALQLQLLGRHADKLADADGRTKVLKRVAIVEAELARLTNLLDDFLNLAKPQRLQLSPIALRGLLQEVHALQEPAIRRAHLKFVLEPGDTDLFALGDHGTLKQVLVNLVVNAFDALKGQTDGRVKLRAFAQGETRVGIEVSDNGPGIAPEIVDNLFTPFFTSKEAGTGLGLTIVKRILDRHGGSIQFVSPHGGGTTARISLERSPAPGPC